MSLQSYCQRFMNVNARITLMSVLLLGVTCPGFAQVSDATCPMKIDSVKQSSGTFGIGSSVGHTDSGGKLSFQYKNVSGRDIQSISLRASGGKVVGGPGGPVVNKSQTVVVDGPMPAGSSKKVSVKLPKGNWYNLELEQVQYSNGDTWTNDGKAECLVNAKGGAWR